MTNPLRWPVVVALVVSLSSFAFADKLESSSQKTSRLRLFNTAIFDKSTAESVVLLKPAIPGQLAPETVMVDIDKGKYFAATVRYPKNISFADARRSLNTIHAKHEMKDFADDKLTIQLTEDEDYLEVIYVKFSLLTKEKFIKSLGRAMRDLEKEDAQQ